MSAFKGRVQKRGQFYNNNIFVYKLDDNSQYLEVKVYDIKEKIQVGIFEDLTIDLNYIE